MAVLDFPSSPTLNQTYAAPNGVTYQWDGAAWVTTGGPANVWTDTGTALTPTDATKVVLVTEPNSTSEAYQLAVSGTTAKAYIDHNGTGVALRYNNKQASGSLLDDTSKASWVTLMGYGDALNVYRAPATTGTPAFAGLLTLDSGGKLSVPGPATGDQTAIYFGTGTPKGHLSILPGYNQLHLAANRFFNGAWARDDTSKVAWDVGLKMDSDTFEITHTVVAGTETTLLTLDNAGNLTIAGATAIKASGTAWSNPSDIRLKQDIAPYERGLADILRLAPITYRLKADPERECQGFDAAAVKEVFPECVSTTRMKLDPADEEDTEVFVFDMHPILVALVNAIKELAATADA